MWIMKEKIYLHHYRVGLVCNDSRVLPTLVDRLKEPWSIINEEEGIYYWSSSHFEALATVYEVDECASRLLSRLNGLIKIYFLPEKGLEEVEDSPISHALNHFGKEANWHNLFNVYEIIRKDYNNSQGITNPRQFILLPEKWTRDEWGRNREKDFTESANNAYVSGINARHSIAESQKVNPVANSSLFRLVHTNEEILPMTLDMAKIFIANLLAQWLTKREVLVTNSPKQGAL